ncbi:MAG TPA: hypothetical protein VMF89_26655, partial [Polyangiales bacterium]|nr:hypothetical protein [Polyangiales bacterium]
MPEVTLDDCDREPIHIPGAVQPHGVLLACRADEPLTVVHVSANIKVMIGCEPSEALGASLLELFKPEAHAFLRALPQRASLRELNPRRLQLRNGKLVQAVMHRSAELLVIELEPNGGSYEGFDPRLRTA